MRNQILIFYFPSNFFYQMLNMFKGASAFNQNLCHFGANFGQIFTTPVLGTTNMFEDSGCSDRGTPTGEYGPWCVPVSTCI